MDILLYGIQGAGKGTQSQKILQYFGDKYSYFEAGNILRAIKSKPNAIGDYVQRIIDKGELVDDELITAFFDAYLITLQKGQNMLIDGYPRKIGQLYMFLERNKKLKRDLVAIYLDLDKNEAIRRLSGRRICRGCSAVYNIYTNQDIEKCKQCGGELYIREDDKPEIIEKRINLFFEETWPVIQYFEKNNLLIKVDANQFPDEVFKQILKALGK